MLWIKRNTRLLLCCLFTLCLGGASGYLLSSASVPPEPSQQDDMQQAVEPVGQIGQPSILPSTTVDTTYYFLLCGHECNKEEVGGSLIGYTLEDVTALWQDARVTTLNGEQAVIERELEQYCPKHYILQTKSDQMLDVLHTDEQSLETSVLMTIPIDLTRVHDEVRALLDEGLVFDSLEQINAYLEDIDS